MSQDRLMASIRENHCPRLVQRIESNIAAGMDRIEAMAEAALFLAAESHREAQRVKATADRLSDTMDKATADMLELLAIVRSKQ